MTGVDVLFICNMLCRCLPLISLDLPVSASLMSYLQVSCVPPSLVSASQVSVGLQASDCRVFAGLSTADTTHSVSAE